MSAVAVFNFEEVGAVSVITEENGEPLFNANDLCGVLGYSNQRDAVIRHVDEDDVVKRDTIDSMGRTQQTNFLREAGMWALIMRSNAANAKPVQRWVTSEVLPSIRKTGSYGVPDFLKPIDKPLTIEEFAHRHATLMTAMNELKEAPVYVVMSGEDYARFLEKPVPRQDLEEVRQNRRWLESDLEQIARDRRDGMTFRQIGKKFGCSTQAVIHVWRDKGLGAISNA